jgi:hypothetical protein
MTTVKPQSFKNKLLIFALRGNNRKEKRRRIGRRKKGCLTSPTLQQL